eukprot:GHVS01068877.1.p1 GENE.GHVS01068877.1~~GHVS01068877.1.p1  ORF type:complete len:151 (-),score=8.48 GHVS01068877.1:8-460(-)
MKPFGPFLQRTSPYRAARGDRCHRLGNLEAGCQAFDLNTPDDGVDEFVRPRPGAVEFRRYKDRTHERKGIFPLPMLLDLPAARATKLRLDLAMDQEAAASKSEKGERLAAPDRSAAEPIRRQANTAGTCLENRSSSRASGDGGILQENPR